MHRNILRRNMHRKILVLQLAAGKHPLVEVKEFFEDKG